MAKTAGSTRAPRGTKILAQAFFSAADEIPESQRAAVIKAALTAIRDELKDVRERAAVAKARARANAPTARGRKAAGRPKAAAKTTRQAATGKAKAARKASPTAARAKAPAKRGRKPGGKSAQRPEQQVESEMNPEMPANQEC